MGRLALILVLLVALLVFGLVPVLMFGGWIVAAVLGLILVIWIVVGLLGLVAAPFALLADLLGRSKKPTSSAASYPSWPSKTIPRRGDPNFDAYIRWANHQPPEPGDPTYPKSADDSEVADLPDLPDYVGDTWEGPVPKRGTPEHKRYLRWANREERRD